MYSNPIPKEVFKMFDKFCYEDISGPTIPDSA